MLFPSRSRSSLLCAALAAILLFGPVGCASSQPREKWWQFWRPKKLNVADSSLHMPDRALLPPGLNDPNDPMKGEPLDVASVPDAPGNVAIPDMGLPEPGSIRKPGEPVGDLITVHFAFDSYALDSAAQQTLDRNLEWIKSHEGTQILIEGHCDDRGTVEYNMSLGQKRANAVKAYLVQRGASEAALHTISYGQERPLDPSTSETAWAKNRRAQFLVY